MFQSFDDIGGPANGAERLRLLRAELARLDLTGFLVPRADEYQNEYVPPDAEQLLWLTGFSGSWGMAAILMEKAALFVDGRYTLQAQSQVDGTAYEIVKVSDTPLAEWLKANLQPGDRFGYDPRRHTVGEVKGLLKCVERAGAALVPVEPNPLASLWTDRPAQPPRAIELQPIAFAGVEAAAKIAEIQEKLIRDKQDAVVIAALDSIAWLFNIRGSDLPHTPFVLSHAIVPAEGKARLFIDGRKLQMEAPAVLSAVADVAEPSALPDASANWAGAARRCGSIPPASRNGSPII